ncbi:hypothetical protein D3C76_1077760 [compost metagenome]
MGDPGARHYQRDAQPLPLSPVRGEPGPGAAGSEDRQAGAGTQPRGDERVQSHRLRHSPPLLPCRAGCGGGSPQGAAAGISGHQQLPAGPEVPAASGGHPGPRVVPGPPAARLPAGTQPAGRPHQLARRVHQPPGHSPDRLHHHGCLPARLRFRAGQPLSGAAPRLRRPRGVGREGHQPLPAARHRSQGQDAGLL